MRNSMFAAAVVLVASGCGGGSTKPRAATAPKTHVPPGLAGAYVRSISRAEIRAAGASLSGPPLGLPTGRATLRIIPDGTIGISLSDGGVEGGTFSATGGRLWVKLPGLCRPRMPGVGSYRFTRSSTGLTIEPARDSAKCRDRRAALVGRWKRAR